jgi:hypothetical protein
MICRADYATPLYPQKLALNSPTSGGRSVGIVLSRTQAPEFVCFVTIPEFVLELLVMKSEIIAAVKFQDLTAVTRKISISYDLMPTKAYGVKSSKKVRFTFFVRFPFTKVAFLRVQKFLLNANASEFTESERKGVY